MVEISLWSPTVSVCATSMLIAVETVSVCATSMQIAIDRDRCMQSALFTLVNLQSKTMLHRVPGDHYPQEF